MWSLKTELCIDILSTIQKFPPEVELSVFLKSLKHFLVICTVLCDRIWLIVSLFILPNYTLEIVLILFNIYLSSFKLLSCIKNRSQTRQVLNPDFCLPCIISCSPGLEEFNTVCHSLLSFVHFKNRADI